MHEWTLGSIVPCFVPSMGTVVTGGRLCVAVYHSYRLERSLLLPKRENALRIALVLAIHVKDNVYQPADFKAAAASIVGQTIVLCGLPYIRLSPCRLWAQPILADVTCFL